MSGSAFKRRPVEMNSVDVEMEGFVGMRSARCEANMVLHEVSDNFQMANILCEKSVNGAETVLEVSADRSF